MRNQSDLVAPGFLGLLLVLLMGAAAPAEPATAPTTKPLSPEEKAALLGKDVTQGALRVVRPDGTLIECPLKHTDVKADISGFIGRVKVTQTFSNPTAEKIEAVYVFPLPHEAAVDDMTMVIGQRKIVGIIKRRAEARQIYERALAAGQTAALLEQERPNIFTQSVGNIEPGQDINIEIAYVDVLKYDLGSYEFHFPVVVGPRYNPGAPLTSPPPVGPEQAGKVAPPAADTNRVPDASRISPPYMKPEFRNGHDISLSVTLNAGVPIQDLKSANHKASIARDQTTPAGAIVTLDPLDNLPNKDFVLRYAVVGKKPEMAMLAHTGEKEGSGYFMLMVQPKEDERLTKSPPREIVFLVDVSGSMSGQPTAKNVECIQKMLQLCREDKDTVQVITFASQSQKLFEKPLPVNQKSIDRAMDFSSGLQGSGGTEMLKGVQMAIDGPVDAERVRIVIMLTDGFIGNEKEIIEYVGKHCGDKVRFWCIGIGSAPNMFLVDGVAKQGGGMGKKLELNADSAALSQEVMTRIQRAQLAKVKIDWGELKVSETYPAAVPELWAGRPVIVYGRYEGGGKEMAVTLSGEIEGQPASWPLKVSLPAREPGNEVLSKVWARQKIEDLMQQTYYGGTPEVEEVVTNIALDYRLMSQYTSFVAVDEKEAKTNGQPARPPRRMMVPVPIPAGTRFEGFFGGEGEKREQLDELAVIRRLDSEKPGVANGPAGGQGGGGWGYGAPAALRPRAGADYDRQKLAQGRGQLSAGNSLFAATPPAPLASGRPAISKDTSGVVVSGGTLSLSGAAALPSTQPAIDGHFYTPRALAGNVEPLVKAAAEALKSGQELATKGDLAAARAAYNRAYFLDSAAANVGGSDGSTAEAALAALQTIHEKLVADLAKGPLPVLNTKLDVVIRDKSLAEALAIVSKSIEILPGSEADAAALLHRKELRITYLDLRNATVAQALDWICQPNRLSWWEVNGKVLVGSDRRRVGENAWVYDVSLISLPDKAELDKLGDYQKAIEAARKSAEQFMAGIRSVLKIKGETEIVWFAPGQMLVIGDPKLQEAAGNLFKTLASPQLQIEFASKEMAELYAVTSERAAKRKEAAAQADANRELLRIAAVHERFGWQLLAAAADGKIDDEAVTELTIAWNAPQTAELLNGKGAAIILRSAWLALESRRALPVKEDEPGPLTILAAHVSKQIAAPALKSVGLLGLVNATDYGPMVMSALYAAMAERDDPKFVEMTLPILASARVADALAPVRTLAKALLDDPKKIDRAALAALLKTGVHGDDMTLLLALACRRAGGETWEAFRASSKDLLGGQPLDGNVIVLINRLATTSLGGLVASK